MEVVRILAVGMFAMLADKMNIDFDLETMLTCKAYGDPEHDPRIEIA